MTDLPGLLTETFAELGRRAPHDPDLAGSVRRRGRRQVAVLLSAVAVLALVGTAAVAVDRLRAPGPTVAAAPPAGCPAPTVGPLPEWARTGFSGPDPVMPFVYSRDGGMVAILFGDPLTAPPPTDRSNKILWVFRPLSEGSYVIPGDSFVVEARLEGSDLRVRRELGLAPGPSALDLPEPGCWQLDLHWGSYTDRVSLRYVPG